MAVIQPEQLFDQADQLLIYRRPKHPSQADLRRAVSVSYYGLFHLICTDAADLFASKGQRSAHTLVYRSLDHLQLRRVCMTIQSPKLDSSIGAMLPGATFTSGLVEFAAIVVELQSARNQADYDPDPTYSIANARTAIQSARDAVALYRQIAQISPAFDRSVFLTLLMFKRR